MNDTSKHHYFYCIDEHVCRIHLCIYCSTLRYTFILHTFKIHFACINLTMPCIFEIIWQNKGQKLYIHTHTHTHTHTYCRDTQLMYVQGEILFVMYWRYTVFNFGLQKMGVLCGHLWFRPLWVFIYWSFTLHQLYTFWESNILSISLL